MTSRILRRLLLLPLVPLLLVRGAAAAPLDDGLAEFRLAQSGSEEACIRAVAAFDAILATEPDNALARAYRGAALVLRARHHPPGRALALAKQGFADLDAAVAATPADPAVRLVRAVNASQMPLALARDAIAHEDFAMLLDAARDENVTLPPDLRRAIFFHAGAFALRDRRPESIALLEAAAATEASDPGDELVGNMLALARRQFTPASDAENTAQPHEAPPSGP